MGVKLPGINYNTPVQSLGRENINFPAQKAAVNTSIAGSVISSLAAFANQKIKKEFDVDTEDANNAYTISRSQAMDAKQRLISMNSYSPDELNDNILYRETKKGVGKDGSEIEITRKSIPASEVNPQLFEQTMNNIRSQGSENLSPAAQKMYNKQFDKLYMGYREQIMADNRNKSVKDRITDVLDASMKLARSGDFAGAALNIQASNMPQSMKSQQINKIDLLAEESTILSSINNQDLMMMEYNLERIKDDLYEGPFTPNQRQLAVRDLENGIKNSLAEAEEMMSRKEAKQYGNLIISAERGQLSYLQAETAWNNEIIKTGTQYASIVKTIDRIQAEKETETEAMINVYKILSTDGMRFSPTDTTNKNAQKKGVDAYYAENQSKKVAVNLAKKGILPTQVKNLFSAFNRGGSTKQVAEVSRLYADIVRVAPKTLQDIPERHRNDMANMAELINAGVTGPEAVKILDKWDNRSDAEKKIIDSRYKTEVLGGRPAKFFYEKQYTELRGRLNGDDKYDKTFWGMGGAPEPSTAMTTEYDMLKRRYYQSYGDMGKAANRAYEILSTTWDYSEINGTKQILRHGVEAEYSMPTKAVKSQLKAYLKGEGITSEAKLSNTSDTPVNKTYQISDKDGYPLYGKDNKPLRQWKPDYEPYAKAKKADEKKKEAARKEEAIKEREQFKYDQRRSKLSSAGQYNKATGMYSEGARNIYSNTNPFKSKKRTKEETKKLKKENFNRSVGFYSGSKSIYEWESANDKRKNRKK